MNWRIRCCSSLTRKDENERENNGTIVVVEVHLVIRIHRKRGTKRGRTRNWDSLDGKYKGDILEQMVGDNFRIFR